MDSISKCETCGGKRTEKTFFIGKNLKTILVDSCNCLKIKREQEENLSIRVEKRRMLKARYKKALFTRKQRGMRLKNLTCEYKLKAENFVKNFSKRQKGLFFIGKTGNGKTTLANSIGKELLLKGYSVLTMNFAEYLNKLQQTYSNKSEITFDELLEQWTNKTDLLIIDDFGRESYTDKRLENTFLFFDKLYNNCTTYIITANPENMAKLKNIPEFNALLDRLAENLHKVKFEKGSFRRLLEVC